MADCQHTCCACGGQFAYDYHGGRKRAYCPSCTPMRAGWKHRVYACEGCGKGGCRTVKGLCASCSTVSIRIMRARRMRAYKGRRADLVPFFGFSARPVSLVCADCGQPFEFTADSGRVRGVPRRFCGRECQKRASDRVRSKTRRAVTRGASAVESVDPSVVFARDGWTCQICGAKTLKSKRGSFHPRAPELDHILPLSLGGPHSYLNTQCACRSCNARKGSKAYGQLMLFHAA